MKTGDYFVENSFRKRIVNARGKFFTQFMSGELTNDNLYKRKALEESIKMGGYEADIRKQVTNRTDTQQPMAGHSEFWIG